MDPVDCGAGSAPFLLRAAPAAADLLCNSSRSKSAVLERSTALPMVEMLAEIRGSPAPPDSGGTGAAGDATLDAATAFDEDSPNDFFDSPTAAMSSELPLLLFSTRSFSVRAGVDGADSDDEPAADRLAALPSDSEAIVMLLGGSTVRRCCCCCCWTVVWLSSEPPDDGGGAVVDETVGDCVRFDDEPPPVTPRRRCAAAAATADAAEPSNSEPRLRLPARAVY